ncbi:galactosylceramide sulfotransferase-like [Saccoglossus kowalevskii]|uniref:Galactosylceramide sulfotransferase-like n=1 Tax=Saccoglossus kowalevskii TaxID=10224 RepID=A0ABM0M571_SACKO|nr:PREDICTED: galactosylceramide sulfotransferase-like [Saccoglossus kowalevskii]
MGNYGSWRIDGDNKQISFFLTVLLINVTAMVWYSIVLSRDIDGSPIKSIEPQSAFLGKIHLNPINNIVYIKTHKTASTSLHCILCRYGYKNRLSFLFSRLNRDNGHLRKTALRPSRFLPPIGNTGNSSSFKYNILTGHVTYSRRRIGSFMESNPKYITILREPARQIESHMNFFRQRKRVMNGLRLFTENATKFENGGNAGSRNNQIVDLGLTLSETANETIINETILKLDKEFDLVLIAEYFDESLVLLKRILHWSFDDILYLVKNQRGHRENITDDFRPKIYKWSRADVLLYQYFYERLWTRIEQYGPGFEADLAFFRHRLREINNWCSTSQKVVVNKAYKSKQLEFTSKNNSTFCQHLAYSSNDWYKHIAIRQDRNAF